MQQELQQSIEELERNVEEAKKRLRDARLAQPRQEVQDYEFQTWDRGAVRLSELFGDKDELIVVHNMGERCPYCTLWADGLNGLAGHIVNRCAFAVASPDEPVVQRRFSQSRGWTFPTVSTHGNTFTRDMGFEPEPKAYWPGYSTFKKEGNRIYKVASAHFGPGDDYCAVWPMFDLLPNGVNDWEPDMSYSPTIRP